MKENELIEDTTSDIPLESPVLVVFAYLNPIALGLAIGLVSGLWIAIATVVLVIQGGITIGPRLSLLAQYFPGYTVTWSGAMWGFIYAFIAAFIFGYIFAAMRNFFLWSFIHRVRRRAERAAFSDLP